MFEKINFIENPKNRIYIFVFLSIVYLILQVSFLDKAPDIMVDEPWYASTAYNILIQHKMVTVVGQENWISLYPLLMAAFFSIFGTTLFTARLFSTLAGLIGLIGFTYILKKFRIKNSIILFGGLLYVFASINYIIFRTARPEGWLVAFIIWSLYFLFEAIKSNKALNYFLSGLLISTSFLIYPHGALYVFLFSIVILFFSFNKRKFSFFVNFLLGCMPVFVVLFIYIIIIKEQNLLTFFGNWLDRTSLSSSNVFISIYEVSFTFIKTYSLGIKRLFIFIAEIGVLIIGLFYYKKDKYIFIISSLGLSYFILEIIFLNPLANRHFGETVTLSLISFALILNRFKDRKKIYNFIFIFGIIYLFNNLAAELYVIRRDFKKTSYSYIEKRIDEVVPDRAEVLTLMHFWFPLKNNENYNLRTRWKKKGYESLDDLLESGDLDYVVISDFQTREVTGTSGRKVGKNKIEKRKSYYNKVHNFAKENGYLKDEILTNNYGNIEIWKINKKFLN